MTEGNSIGTFLITRTYRGGCLSGLSAFNWVYCQQNPPSILPARTEHQWFRVSGQRELALLVEPRISFSSQENRKSVDLLESIRSPYSPVIVFQIHKIGTLINVITLSDSVEKGRYLGNCRGEDSSVGPLARVFGAKICLAANERRLVTLRLLIE